MDVRPVDRIPWWRRTGDHRTPESPLGALPNDALVEPRSRCKRQAVYRGHRLFDSDHVREGVTRSVQWFKSNRDILESDLIHTSSRRADGTHPDWYFHANPRIEE